MRVLVIGASIPLPTDELRYEDTWIYRLEKTRPDLEIVDKCIRARSVTTLMHGGPYGQAKNLFEWYSPDIVIIHLGLTDCAPRLLPHNSKRKKIIDHLPFASIVYRYLKTHQGRKIEYADVSPQHYYDNLNGYVNKVSPIPVGIVEISYVTENALKKSPRFNQAIEIYNNIIHNVCRNNDNAHLIKGLDATKEDMYQSDGMHLTAKGQEVILERCMLFVDKVLKINILPPPRKMKDM